VPSTGVNGITSATAIPLSQPFHASEASRIIEEYKAVFEIGSKSDTYAIERQKDDRDRWWNYSLTSNPIFTFVRNWGSSVDSSWIDWS
jgi:hypothetical protein